MPLSIFHRSPQPSDSPSRFSAFHANVRSLLNGSSIYSNSPVLSSDHEDHSDRGSRSIPKLPAFDFFRRNSTPLVLPTTELQQGSRSNTVLSPPVLNYQHTAGSYIQDIGNSTPEIQEQYLVTPPTLFSPDATPPLRQHLDSETEQSTERVPGRRPRRHRRRHRHRTRPAVVPFIRTGPQAWVRKKRERGSCSVSNNKAARGKLTSVTISAVFLGVILSIYLCIVLLRPNIGQEVHVLFILVIICTTIFFCHALVRLCMVAMSPPLDTPRMTNMQDTEGFHPVRPIRVHVARDEELADDMDEESEGSPVESISKGPKIPPPAYGKWRSSVRVDPNLLHWQRVSHIDSSRANEAELASPHSSVGQSPTSRSPVRPAVIARPPSYASDDGVAYVVSAAPRSTAPSQGMFEIHPAFRHPADRLEMPSDR
ncbi:hypothetical protein EJ05DRAFT_227266 [Pseudovirgaria hyperparasitica]|uniref:Uncharacterized protein n=1 Tax=Pseudovirgaria hyperparasitica TaxID=470096 RepID=A0A6A6VRD7_9PEZI|nr:uncharacterized protein EJ05DRAFT_227266 [Pseudovirgaria hyperparasitica]KAF2753162.1 hypothetical protein EJ05DRAFT_227266 [Pseudovirgaria hyperparasitica]